MLLPDGTSILFKATPICEGPLNGVLNNPQQNFRSNTYNVIKTNEEIVLYRHYGGHAGPNGSWWSTEKTEGNLSTRMGHAILPSWGNTMEKITSMKIPAGTILYSGCAGEQREKSTNREDLSKFNQHLLGGNNQIYVPEEIHSGILEYNQSGNATVLFNAQKTMLQSWEQDNFKITNNNGKALSFSGNQLIKLQNAVINKELIKPVTDNKPKMYMNGSCRPSEKLGSISYNPPPRDARASAQEAVQSQFCASANIPASQCYMSAPWPGGVELMNPLKIFMGDSIINKPIISLTNRGIKIGNFFPVTKMEIKTSTKNIKLDSLSLEEMRCLFNACTKSTKRGVMLSLQLGFDSLKVETDGFNPDVNKTVYENIKSADNLLADLIFGTNSFQTALLFEKPAIQLMRPPISTYRNPYDEEIDLLTKDSEKALKFQNDVHNFSIISPYPKFQINKHAKLKLFNNSRQHNSSMLWCNACPLAIGLRGLYSDYYGNQYFDDKGERCLANLPFWNDWQKNYSSYLQYYPVLKKVASYAIFIGAVLNGSFINNNNRIDIQKSISIKLNPPKFDEEVTAVEDKLLKTRIKILNQNIANKNLLTTIRLGNLINDELPVARAYYFEALTEATKEYVLIKNSRTNTETDLLKKRIIKDACKGIFSTVALNGFTNADNHFTNGEKQLISKLLLIEMSATNFEFSLCVFETALKLVINLENWNEVQQILRMFSCLLQSEQNNYANQKFPKSKECFQNLLNDKTWTTVKNGKEIHETINQMLAQQTETKLKALCDRLFKLLSFKENKYISEDTKQKMLTLTAIGYQLLPFIWHKIQLKQKPLDKKKYINEIHIQAAYCIRALTSMIYLIKNGSASDSPKWIVLAQKCIKTFSEMAGYGHEFLLLYEFEEKSAKVATKIKSFLENGNINEIPHKLFKEVYDLRLIAQTIGLMEYVADTSEILAVLNKKVHKFSPELSEIWMQRAKQERQLAKQQKP